LFRLFHTVLTSTRAISAPQLPTDRKHFLVAIVCALPREADAVTLLFDQSWDEDRDPYGRADGDTNHYTTGRIGDHHVVLAVLPCMGTNSAAAATASLRSSYTNLKLAILIDICGGVPRVGDHDAFLGDVVVSKTIIQNDYGRQYPGHSAVKNTVKDNLGRANRDIRSLLAMFQTELMRERLQVEATAPEAAKKKRRRANYQFPGTAKDTLYDPNYTHRHPEGCIACTDDPSVFCESASRASCVEVECDPSVVIARERSMNLVSSGDFSPENFIGRIGSRNIVMQSGTDWDHIANEHDLVAFEMEGAGAWDEVSCIVVKGICDYADSHKNKSWQDFAAATAAAVAKAILGRFAVHDGDRDTPSRNCTNWSSVRDS
jgi:nucleoside phosphorylase